MIEPGVFVSAVPSLRIAFDRIRTQFSSRRERLVLETKRARGKVVITMD